MSSTQVSETVSSVMKLVQDAGLTPRGIQSAAIDAGLLDGKSVLVSSPTGSGKTFVGELALLRAVCEGSRGIYLVPLRALAVQVTDKLRERYEKRGIPVAMSTGDFELPGDDLAHYDIVVTTYERADSLLRHGTEWLKEIGTVVIDEVQNLADEVRGPRLESVILRLRRLVPTIQIVALSATIGSPQELADWLDCRLIESSVRPVPLKCSVIAAHDKDRAVREVVMTTIQRNGQVLVFNRTRKEAEAEAQRLSSQVMRQMTNLERSTVDQELDSVENWNVILPQDLRPLLHDGVAYHHAGLAASTRRLVEALFARGLVRVVCATTTLSAGMDLPARTVVITNIRAPQDHRSLLPVNQAHQMLGRAGRPGKDTKGFGVILTGSSAEADDVKQRYFTNAKDEATGADMLEPRYAPVESRLSGSAALTEQLLVFVDHLGETSLEAVENDILADSYSSFTSRFRRAPLRLFHLGEITTAAAVEKHALSDTVRAARQGILGSVNIREKRDVVLGGIVHEREGASYTCRFSIMISPAGAVEGPMCSCGRPMDDDGILCVHLMSLALHAAKDEPELADYVIPLSLSETSPYGTLVRLGLIEGSSDGMVRVTQLGRVVNRLYLKIPTVRELLALLPFVEDNTQLVGLVKHLALMETGQNPDVAFETIIGTIVATALPMQEIASTAGVPVGDVFTVLDRTKWLLHSVATVAKTGGLSRVSSIATELKELLEARMFKEDVTVGGDD